MDKKKNVFSFYNGPTADELEEKNLIFQGYKDSNGKMHDFIIVDGSVYKKGQLVSVTEALKMKVENEKKQILGPSGTRIQDEE